MHQHALAPQARLASNRMRAPLRLRFGFPRVYLVKMLQRKIAEQLYIGSEACAIGMRDEDGRFLTLADGDEFDGPDFTLRLIYAIGSQRVFDHGIDVSIGILLGCYVLTVRDQRFNIGFIPTLDEAMLTTAVRWIIRNLDTAALAR